MFKLEFEAKPISSVVADAMLSLTEITEYDYEIY
jgi:hypothetical protein